MAILIERQSIHAIRIVLLVALMAPISVSAQDPIVPLQFSFSDPGARSMGFGGAFVALADDATAAFSNPAGLVQLIRPEVSVEGRGWNYSTPYTEGGRLEGLPSGHGLDSTVGLRTASSDRDVTGLSFVSLAYPQRNWSLAFFRHEFANFEFQSETQGLFRGGTDCCQIRELDHRATSDLESVNYGLSTAYRVNDAFDVGLGVVYYDTSLNSRATLFFPDDDTVPSILGPNSYLPENAYISQRVFTEDGTGFAYTAGFLWRLSQSWSIGGVYRQGLTIDIGAEVTAGEAADFAVPGEVVAQASGLGLDLPGIYGFGFAYRAPNGRLTVTFQWDRVEYSSIRDSLDLDEQTIEDVDELHLGAEYVFLDSTPIIAVRLGAWLEPDHQIRSISDDVIQRALLPQGDDDMHYTAGIGVAMQNFQIDLGIDFADRVDTVSLSAIYSL